MESLVMYFQAKLLVGYFDEHLIIHPVGSLTGDRSISQITLFLIDFLQNLKIDISLRLTTTMPLPFRQEEGAHHVSNNG
jgi:hypothetical protein